MAHRHKSIRHKSLRRKSLRRKNRTTLKRGGVKKITDYKSKSKKTKTLNKSTNNTETPGVFYRAPDYRANMTEEQKAKIQKDIDERLKTYLENNGIKNTDSYPSVERVIRKI